MDHPNSPTGAQPAQMAQKRDKPTKSLLVGSAPTPALLPLKRGAGLGGAMNQVINAKIAQVKADIMMKSDLITVWDTPDGLVRCTNKDATLTALFADMGNGSMFNVSGWAKLVKGI